MAGRPKKPILLRAAQGDTRKLGVHQFAAQIAAAFIGTRGKPPDSGDFEPREDDEPDVARRRDRALKHYDYLCEQLGLQGLLCSMDSGILTSMAWCKALMLEAAEVGAVKEFAMLQSEYRASANVTGFNESARAKIPKPAATSDPMEAALAAGFPAAG